MRCHCFVRLSARSRFRRPPRERAIACQKSSRAIGHSSKAGRRSRQGDHDQRRKWMSHSGTCARSWCTVPGRGPWDVLVGLDGADRLSYRSCSGPSSPQTLWARNRRTGIPSRRRGRLCKDFPAPLMSTSSGPISWKPARASGGRISREPGDRRPLFSVPTLKRSVLCSSSFGVLSHFRPREGGIISPDRGPSRAKYGISHHGVIPTQLVALPDNRSAHPRAIPGQPRSTGMRRLHTTRRGHCRFGKRDYWQ